MTSKLLIDLEIACANDKFPYLMAGAIQKTDIEQWDAKNDIVIERGQDSKHSFAIG